MDNEKLGAKPPKPKDSNKKKLVTSLIVMVVGLIALVVGVVMLILNLVREPEMPDGEYLVSAKEWVMLDGANCAEAPADCAKTSVIWKFTEVGKGSLTTNGHKNDYDFIWALDDGRLLVETDWLYELENSYTYELDKRAGRLSLKDGEKAIVFVGDFEDSK